MKPRLIALLLCCFLAAPASLAQSSTPNSPAESTNPLRDFFNRPAVRGALNVVRDIASQVAFTWSTQDARYGLFLDDDWQQRTSTRPLVVIVHGYGSEPEEFESLRARLRADGLATGAFAYPNDAAIALSGREFALALQEFERRYPGRRISLVAHSMGGLVSRMAIEDPDIPEVSNVDRLIMVATPNQGSHLARVPVSLDIWQNWLDGEPDTVRSVFFESVLDGLNEARVDMQPESELIARLNSQPRSPDVRYALILGTRGPATREQIDELRRLIMSRQSTNPALRVLGSELELLLEDLDELVNGLGDGAVAVERGRLQGIDDTIVFDFHHGAINTALTDDTGNRLVAEILTRLNRP